MIYQLFHFLLKVTCRLYFKEIRLLQIQNVPSKNPIIICANHGNSFMDAILIAVVLKRELHFLARADVFNTPFKRWFLSKINMMPIYRIRDGREEVKNNDAIFDKCKTILENNGAILIFPEGNCVVEKRLRTFKTGFIQLAFEAEVKDLQILPVTINYKQPLSFYTNVTIEFSKTLEVASLKSKSNNDYKDFSKKLLAQTIKIISDRMIIIPTAKDDEFYEQILEIYSNSLVADSFEKQLQLVKYLNQIKTDNLLHFNVLNEKVSAYSLLLKQHQILDEAVASEQNFNTHILWFAYPFYVLGLGICYLPTKIINYFINQKVKEIQFKSAIRMVIGMFIYLVYLPIILVIASYTLSFGSIYLLGLLYFYYANFYQLAIAMQINKLKTLDINFKQQRAEIMLLLNL